MTKTLDKTPGMGEMLKPAELIELRSTGPLTLQDRRVFNLLIENAWGPHIAEPGRVFSIETSELKGPTEPNMRLVEAVERLMRTIVTTRDTEGNETRLQLLSTNTLRTTVNRGTFEYCFPPRLAELLKDSTIFAKLDLEVMRSFSSKYAFALYEAISRRVRLRHIFTERLSIADLRELLGVETDKLLPFKNLHRKAIVPAVVEVNAISPYAVTILPRKEGRKVVEFIMGWSMKDQDGMKEAYSELHRPRIGRKERATGTAENLVDTSSIDS